VSFSAAALSSGLLGDTLSSIEAVLLVGSARDDTLTGSSGDDIIGGGAGSDRIDGGAGYDRAGYSFEHLNVGTVFDASGLSQGVAGTLSDGLGGVDTLTNVEAVSCPGDRTGRRADGQRRRRPAVRHGRRRRPARRRRERRHPEHVRGVHTGRRRRATIG
jgi:hypothetical protein